MFDQIFMMVLRVIHIGAGLFWVGSVFFMTRFILPAIQEAGPDGGKFAAVLMRGGRVQRAIIESAGVTIVAGLIMYVRYIVQTNGAWARSPVAMGYGVGAVAALVAFILGVTINAPAARRLQAIMGSAGGPPNAEQQAELVRLRERMASTSRIVLVLLTVAVISMAISRYL
jgi:uncharacterized membrane protein